MRRLKPDEQPEMRFTHSDNLDFTCHVKLVGQDARVTDWSITPEAAVTAITYLRYYIKRQKERLADAPIDVSPQKTRHPDENI